MFAVRPVQTGHNFLNSEDLICIISNFKYIISLLQQCQSNISGYTLVSMFSLKRNVFGVKVVIRESLL